MSNEKRDESNAEHRLRQSTGFLLARVGAESRRRKVSERQR